MRATAALSRLRLRRWPFRGRIAVRERDAESVVMLDRWCYLGTARSEDELFELSAADNAPRFDLDIYRILTRFLARPRASYRVIELARQSVTT
jgi:DNA polymerase-3 subunit epsilon